MHTIVITHLGGIEFMEAAPERDVLLAKVAKFLGEYDNKIVTPDSVLAFLDADPDYSYLLKRFYVYGQR